MRLLLDTHIFLWAISDPKEIARGPAEVIRDPANEVAVSIATAWEICIKASVGKLSGPAVTALGDARKFRNILSQSGFVSLEVTLEDVFATRKLPSRHRDPFDRMLLAQAIVGGWTLMTRDAVMTSYAGVKFILG